MVLTELPEFVMITPSSRGDHTGQMLWQYLNLQQNSADTDNTTDAHGRAQYLQTCIYKYRTDTANNIHMFLTLEFSRISAQDTALTMDNVLEGGSWNCELTGSSSWSC